MVQNKRFIGANKTQKARISGKIAIDMSTGKKLPGELSGTRTRRSKPLSGATVDRVGGSKNAVVRSSNRRRIQRSNEATVVNSRYESRTSGKSERQIVQAKRSVASAKLGTKRLQGGVFPDQQKAARSVNRSASQAVNKNLVATTRNPKLGKNLRSDNQLLAQRKAARSVPATNKPKPLPPLNRDAAADARIVARAAARKQSEKARLDESVKGVKERAKLQNKANSNPFRPRPLTGGYGA
jgi:hypothetical protein